MPSSLHFISLIIELCLNFVGIALGLVLIFRARDNRLMLAWGFFTLFVMVFNAHMGISWLIDYGAGYSYTRVTVLLRIGLLLKTLFGTILATMFPILSLRPSLLTAQRIVVMMIPFLIAAIAVGCFYWFDGAPTPLYNTSDIFTYISLPDVQLRVVLLCMTIVTAILNISWPFVNKWFSLRRRISRAMYIYSVIILATVGLYVMYVATDWVVVFYLYTYVLTLVPIVVAVIYLFSENPLSLPRSDEQVDQQIVKSSTDRNTVDPQFTQLYSQMEEYMRSSSAYVEPNYSIAELAQQMNVSQSAIVRAIRERGFSGFSEYINFLRLEHFKVLAAKFTGLSIKELMIGSGFTSRSSFYRRFMQQENMSPGEYIERKL